ncbi:MAG: biopolymer transporter ExbD [Planctomycetaceae bacterium]|nr:MAG: biopolymer transporter ExbD [Planctomycetaceae bacterium]
MKRTRESQAPSKVDVQMTPMIDIVFQLLIFFLLQLKIVSPEGNFNVNLPIGAPSPTQTEELNLPALKVGLRSDAAGNLTQITFGQINLGTGDAAFERLNQEILRVIQQPGSPFAKEIEVEIDADYELQYRYVIRAISKCMGRYDPQTKQIVRYVEKIKFAPPRQPRGAAS